jgi:hypothetical protein
MIKPSKLLDPALIILGPLLLRPLLLSTFNLLPLLLL